MHHHTKFRKDRLNRCGDIAIFVIFKMAAVAILDFQNIRNFNGRSAARCQYASSYQISSKSGKRLPRCGDLTVFKMAALRHLGFVGRVLGSPAMTTWWSLSLCKIWSSFYNTKLSIFCPFGLNTPIHSPKNWGFGYQRNPQKAHPCASPRRLSHQA